MVNRVILIGNLGRDPEIRRLDNGAVVAKFSVATNENYRDKGGEWQTLTEWHDVVVWRQLAERAESTLKKGSMVYLEGKLTHRTWQDKEGNNRRTTEVVSNYFRVLTRKEGTGDSGGSGYFPSESDEHTAATPAVQTNAPATQSQESAADAPEDDLPF